MNILKRLKRAFEVKNTGSYDAYIQNQKDLKYLEYQMMMTWASNPR